MLRMQALEMMVQHLWNVIFGGTIYYDQEKNEHYIQTFDGRVRQYITDEEHELFDFI